MQDRLCQPGRKTPVSQGGKTHPCAHTQTHTKNMKEERRKRCVGILDGKQRNSEFARRGGMHMTRKINSRIKRTSVATNAWIAGEIFRIRSSGRENANGDARQSNLQGRKNDEKTRGESELLFRAAYLSTLECFSAHQLFHRGDHGE